MTNLPFLLLILDGYANNPNPKANAVFHAKKPNLDRLFSTSPCTELVTFGERVGLPDDQMGNSEVGHLNIGGGRVVEQELTRINRAARTNSFGKIPPLEKAFAAVKADPSRAIHFMGLTSTGGVHSSIEHLQALVRAARDAGVKNIVVHAITDGRDRPPTASLEEVTALKKFLDTEINRDGCRAEIATIVGRYFAMDRDKRWERTEKAYDLFTASAGKKFSSVEEALKKSIEGGATDEFLEPILLVDRPVKDGDALVFFNFRADRMRQIVAAFLGAKADFQGFQAKRRPNLSALCTLTEYDAKLPVDVLFAPFVVKNHFGDVVAAAGLRQLRIAETEKYAHVTYFFNGGMETPVKGEERVLIPSPRDVPTYDHKPEMSAYEVTDALLERLKEKKFDVAILNFANCDMVGHTGNFDAAVKAVEAVDSCCGRIFAALAEQNGCAIVTADHGNCDQMVDYETGEPHTFHTKYPVPLSVYNAKDPMLKLRRGGSLCDIAPTACALIGLTAPPEMTGRSLIEAR